MGTDELPPLTEEDFRVSEELFPTDFVIKKSDILSFLTDLASGRFVFKIELINLDEGKDKLITKIGPKYKKNLINLLSLYNDGLKKSVKYSIWVVLHPLDTRQLKRYQLESYLEGYHYGPDHLGRECEIYFHPLSTPKDSLRLFYIYEDPKKEHECIFGKKVEDRLKKRCNYFASLLEKYLRPSKYNPAKNRPID